MGATVPSPDLGRVQSDLETFLASRRSLVLGTQAEDGRVELSVAPFVASEEGFAVFLSDLAPHTANLRRSASVEALLLEDEADARQPFARTRVSLACSAMPIQSDDERGEVVLDQMESLFGGIVPLLRGLPDFHLFLLRPVSGRYVAGFGKAYRMEGLRVVEHLRG